MYTLTVGPEIKDCIGNAIGSGNQLQFGLTVEPAEGDLVINEVLYNPQIGGSDFLELYNRSDKIININGIEIINAQRNSGNFQQEIEEDFLLLPGGYVALSADPEDIKSRYIIQDEQAFLQHDLPTLPPDFSNVTIRYANITLDSFDYDDDLHFALLDDERGVSLERLDPEANTNDAGNWHSAAATAGFATPGYENSQFIPSPNVIGTIINIPQKRFSPDGDGFEDVLQIQYNVDRPDYLLNIDIFDAQGRLVKKLIRNTLLAASGSFKWDGVTNENSKARIGIYVVWIELFTPEGMVDRQKEVIVVAGKLD